MLHEQPGGENEDAGLHAGVVQAAALNHLFQVGVKVVGRPDTFG